MSPTFQNVSTVRKTLEGKTVDPGKEVCTFVHYDENAIQLLKVSDKPFWNSTVFSEKITQSTTIVIPKEDSLHIPILKYAIHFCVVSGEVELFYNSTENLPSLKLYTGCKWNVRNFERYISTIVVRGLSGKFELWVIVEKLF